MYPAQGVDSLTLNLTALFVPVISLLKVTYGLGAKVICGLSRETAPPTGTPPPARLVANV